MGRFLRRRGIIARREAGGFGGVWWVASRMGARCAGWFTRPRCGDVVRCELWGARRVRVPCVVGDALLCERRSPVPNANGVLTILHAARSIF